MPNTLEQLQQMITDLSTDVPKRSIVITYVDRVLTIPIDAGDTAYDGVINNLKDILITKAASAAEEESAL